jgi:hypothetical protein
MATSLAGSQPSAHPVPVRLSLPALAGGEFAAFLVPLALGVLGAKAWGLEGFALWGILVAGGLGHGLLLGLVQAPVVHAAVPTVNRPLWVVATTLAMGFAWAFTWLAVTYHGRGEPTGIVASIALIAIGVSSIASGVPQAEVFSAANVRYSHLWVLFGIASRAAALAPIGIAAAIVDWHGSGAEIAGAFAAAAVASAVIAAFLSGKAIERMGQLGLRAPEQG